LEAEEAVEAVDDSKAFELMGKHVALAGTKSGCRYISSGGLVSTLLKLLLAATPRVQRQVVHVLSCLMIYMPPKLMMRPAVSICMGAQGATKLLLLMVAKTLELDLRIRGTGKVPSRKPNPNPNPNWRCREGTFKEM